jgi:hypothetical protein
MSVEEIDFRNNSNCNRGILIKAGLEKMEYCLCPPGYYGNQCQMQNQRVSLTIQFNKECDSNCRGIYSIILILIDSNKIIHSYEQMTYISTRNCDLKHHFNLLYQSRPKDLTKNYTIHIDIYNRIDLTYYTSWIIPIPFVFLPVNRISTHVTIPSHPIESIRENDCNCSSSSICIGIVNHRSICLCSFNKSGPRCFLPSACQSNPCYNGGQCIPEDDRWSINRFICLCPEGYFGETCQEKNMRIDISFDDVEIPQALLIYFVTVQTKADPVITTISKKIGLDEDTTTVYTSMVYNMIFVQFQSEYYLIFIQMKAIHRSENAIKVKSSHLCPSIHLLLDKQIATLPFLRRAKFYHIPCKDNLQLSCFHDSESLMCLCNKDRYANCFPFHFANKSTCLGRTRCENDGQLRKKKSITIARWIIVGIILSTFISYIHDLFYRQLINADEEHRTWCIIRYSFLPKIFDSIIRIIHFVIPFILNLISALIIIITVARVRSNAHKKKKYKQHLYEQFNEHKRLIISPIILLIFVTICERYKTLLLLRVS